MAPAAVLLYLHYYNDYQEDPHQAQPDAGRRHHMRGVQNDAPRPRGRGRARGRNRNIIGVAVAGAVLI